MKNLPSSYKYILSLIICLMTTCFLAINIDAQKITEINKNTVINRRVFYGEASFYADKFNGRHTANDEIFSQNKLTCACNMLPFGTYIKVTNVRNGKWAVVKVNDRLHPRMKRIVDLTKSTAIKLGFHGNGLARVKIEYPVAKNLIKN